MRSRILIGLIMGTIGGFLGFLLQENLVHAAGGYKVEENLLTHTIHVIQLTPGQNWIFNWSVGGLIGLCLGTVEGIVQGNPRKIAQNAILGIFAGGILGSIGYNMGSLLFRLLGGSDEVGDAANMLGFVKQIIARSFGWSLLGLGLGVGAALPTLSPARIRNGAIGGFLGGFLGGFVFELVIPLSNQIQAGVAGTGMREVGGPGRAIGLTAIGGLTGFFIGLVEEWLKQAWVKVLAGRNEGKDFILTKATSILGRDERADVPLFSDNSIAPQHAAIRTDGYQHILLDAGTPQGTLVNGQKLPPNGELLLHDGDMIQIGSQRILFREKATQQRLSAAPTDAPRKPISTAPAMPSHLCPFCGTAKDANGQCLCSPAGAGTPQNMGQMGMGAPMSGNTGFMNMNGQPASYGAPAYGAPATGPGTRGQLVGLEGAIAGMVVSLNAPVLLLGREQGRDIVVPGDTTVSRTHARISNENGIVTVQDNGSANGTFVNGVRIQMQTLAPGDIVQFGNSKFRFE